jgi:hypothetical protein
MVSFFFHGSFAQWIESHDSGSGSRNSCWGAWCGSLGWGPVVRGSGYWCWESSGSVGCLSGFERLGWAEIWPGGGWEDSRCSGRRLTTRPRRAPRVGRAECSPALRALAALSGSPGASTHSACLQGGSLILPLRLLSDSQSGKLIGNSRVAQVIRRKAGRRLRRTPATASRVLPGHSEMASDSAARFVVGLALPSWIALGATFDYDARSRP